MLCQTIQGGPQRAFGFEPGCFLDGPLDRGCSFSIRGDHRALYPGIVSTLTHGTSGCRRPRACGIIGSLKSGYKSKLSELAVFGGEPAFASPLHVGEPNFGDPRAFLHRFESILTTRRFTNNGRLVQELEARIAEFTSTAHAVATCNATTGLQLLARALDVRGSVVMPSFTFIGTPHAFAWLGQSPVFCDIEPETHGTDPKSAEAAITSDTSALVAVHTWGIPSRVDELQEVARRRGLPMIFDAAHALGCERDGVRLGGFGTAEVFSLHATKIVNSFEGGMVTTNDSDLAARLRLLRDFGFTGYDRVAAIATNAKLSELHAAAGLTTLDAFGPLAEQNRARFDAYRDHLRGIPGVRLMDPSVRGKSHHQYVVCELVGDAARAGRDGLVQALHAEGIYARRYFHPGCHRMAPYVGSRRVPLPITEAVSDRVFLLPNGPSVTNDAIRTIVDLVALIVEHATEFAELAS